MYRSAEIHPGDLPQRKEGHGGHAVLMDGINRVLFKYSAGRGVVMPPPLAPRALRPTNRLPTITRPVESGLKFVCFRELSQRVDGVYLIGEAADASSERTGKASVSGHVPENALAALIVGQ